MAEAFGENGFEDYQTQQIAKEFEKKINNNELFFIDLNKVSRLYEFYVDGQEWRKAKNLMDFAIQTYPTNSQLFYQKAYLLYELCLYPQAEEAIDHSLNFSPYTLEYLSLKADILAKLARYEESIELLKICLAYTQKKEQVLVHMGNVAQICQYPKQSESYYREALQINESFEEAMIELAYLLEAEDKIEEGIALCQVYLDDNPYAFKVWFRLGNLFRKVRKTEDALDAYDYALVINEDFEEAYICKGEVLMEMESYREALQAFLHALHYSPDHIHVLYHIGDCYENLESFRDAIKYYGMVGRQDPDHVDAWMGIGFCLERSAQYLEAIHYYQKAYNIDDENPDLCLAMAICEYKLGQHYNAYLYLEEAIRLSPNELGIWQDWAQVLYDNRNILGAITYLEEGIKLNPSHPSLYYYCAAYCFEAGMPDKAMTYLENGLIMGPEQAGLLFELRPSLDANEEVREMVEQYS